MSTYTPDDLRAMNIISPQYQGALDTRPLESLPSGISGLRAGRAERLRPLRQLYPIPGPILEEVQEEDIQIPIRDGETITARIYTPIGSSKVSPNGRPVYVAYHEGGWSLGDLTDEDMNCRLFARDLGAVCVNVDYRLAPEHPFPTGINDCWDALKWVAAHAEDTLDANPRQAGFVVGGASAGGNIAAVLAHLARDEKLDPPLTGHHLVCPALLPPQYVPEKYKHLYISATENVNDPVLKGDPNAAGLYESAVVRHVLKADIDSPLFNVFSGKGGQKGLSPCYLQVAGLDPLRDEGLIYERVLRDDNGVKTRMSVYPGFGHMFWTNYPEMARSDEFVADALSGVRWLLSNVQGIE